MKRLKHILKQKIKIHFALLVLMYCFFAICTLSYRRVFSFEEWLQIALYYGILMVILFIINLIKKRWIKWAIFGGFFFIPLTIIFFAGKDNWDFSSLYVYTLWGTINVPFLPENLYFPSQNQNINAFLGYILYFILPIIYWYILYNLSKRIVNKYLKP